MYKPQLEKRALMSMVGLMLLVLLVTIVMRYEKNSLKDNRGLNINQDSTMQLTSSDFTHESSIPMEFSCDGADLSPELSWNEAPEATKSFVLIVRDPDAPMKKEWIHWIVKNISADTRSVAQNAVPAGGIEVVNDFKKTSWGGPCPPDGEHRYFFVLYALDIESVAGDTLDDIETAMEGHILEKAELMGRYNRQ
ncbi:MAG: YbhB/YbcL family Raf kinase inhibitor-like protein [bacterium]|nr:YbhB/YbcL family Raf kinase inhibitor-like protein [bacterium]